MSELKTKLYAEGRSKQVWECENPKHLIVHYKDDLFAYNNQNTEFNKAHLNNRISNNLFEVLEDNGIQTHFVQQLNENETLVKKVEIIPVQIVVRNYAAGSLVKRLGINEGVRLGSTVMEMLYKNEELGTPLINEYHAYTLNLCTAKELEIMCYNAFKINKVLTDYLRRIQLHLVDFRIEFGRCNGRLILADEISPATSRLWHFDEFVHDCKNIEKNEISYNEVLLRLSEVKK